MRAIASAHSSRNLQRLPFCSISVKRVAGRAAASARPGKPAPLPDIRGSLRATDRLELQGIKRLREPEHRVVAPFLHHAAALVAGLDALDEDRQRGDLALSEPVRLGDGANIVFDARGLGVGIHVAAASSWIRDRLATDSRSGLLGPVPCYLARSWRGSDRDHVRDAPTRTPRRVSRCSRSSTSPVPAAVQAGDVLSRTRRLDILFTRQPT